MSSPEPHTDRPTEPTPPPAPPEDTRSPRSSPDPTADHPPPPAASPAPGPPAVLSDLPGYELVGRLGHGGMGVVYRARQIRLNRAVAIKVISAGRHASEDKLARFRTEAEALARL